MTGLAEDGARETGKQAFQYEKELLILCYPSVFGLRSPVFGLNPQKKQILQWLNHHLKSAQTRQICAICVLSQIQLFRKNRKLMCAINK